MRIPFKFIVLSALILLTSCGGDKTKESDSALIPELKADSTKIEDNTAQYVPTIVKGKVTKTLSAGENSETSQIYFEYYLIDEKSPIYLKTVNELISKSVQNEFELTETEKITSNLSKNYFADILIEFKKNFSNVDEQFMPWNLMDSIHIDDSKSNYVHLETFTYSFTGGAHGNGYESHYLVDKTNGNKLTLEDVFNNKRKLNALVDSYFRKSVGVSPNENLQDAGWFIEGRLEANENFYFTDKNVVFLYNSYEIGPYSAGAPTVEVPISKIADLLKINQ